jgi:hypothetical protein
VTRFFTDGYRNQAFATLLGIMSVVFALGAVVYIAAGRSSWPPMLIVIALAAFVLLRLARAGAFVTDAGIIVVNPLRTVRVPWEDVAGFSLKRSGGFPAVGFVDLVDGSRVQVWGIQARSASPSARRAPEQAIEALQARFETERERRSASKSL